MQRIAIISDHASPLTPAGSVDSGGQNIYVAQIARRLCELGHHVDVFTRIAFGEITGVPVLVNTSFNTRGKPIVCTPRDALETFWTSPLDALAIGSFLVEKPCAATN